MNSARAARLVVWLKVRRPRYGTDPRVGRLEHAGFGAGKSRLGTIFAALRMSPLAQLGGRTMSAFVPLLGDKRTSGALIQAHRFMSTLASRRRRAGVG